MNKTAVVTGAFGFIGRSVALKLSNHGWETIGLGHGAWSRREWECWGLSEWHACDITIESLLTYAASPDVILHCAGSGSVGFSMINPMQDYHRTVQTTLNVLEFMRLHSPGCNLVYPSSVAVYGNADYLPIPESAPLNPISPYGVHKKISEDIICSYAKHFRVNSAIVRFFSIYGRHLRKQLLWDACTKINRGDYAFFGSGNEIRDWLHIDDAVELLRCACNRTSHDPLIVNGGSGVGVTIRDLLTEVFSCFEIDMEPQFSASLRPGDPPEYVADIELVKSWNWQPKVSLKSGIRDYVHWYKEEAQ